MSIPTEIWPLAGLRVRTERLELRLPTEADLIALAELAAIGVHAPEAMPFMFPWTDVSPLERAQSVLRYHWGRWSTWSPQDWTLELAVLVDGHVVGLQGISARDFAVVREVNSGSWLGLKYQGRGIGTEMRRAIVHLGFAGLGAEAALSEAFDDNPASRAVSTKLGYQPDGISRVVRRGEAATLHRFRLPKSAWVATPQPPIVITGLNACLTWFGL